MYSFNHILAFVIIGLTVVNATPVPHDVATDSAAELVDRQCIPIAPAPSDCDVTCLVSSALKRALGVDSAAGTAERHAPTLDERQSKNNCIPLPSNIPDNCGPIVPAPSDCDVTCLVNSALKRAPGVHSAAPAERHAPSLDGRQSKDDCAPLPNIPGPAIPASDCDVTCLVTSALKRALAF